MTTRTTTTNSIAHFLYKHSPFDASSASLSAALEAKSTETIRKRAGSLRMFSGWLSASAYSRGDPFNEKAVFEYLGYLTAEL